MHVFTFRYCTANIAPAIGHGFRGPTPPPPFRTTRRRSMWGDFGRALGGSGTAEFRYNFWVADLQSLLEVPHGHFLVISFS